jgi:hypothetical protein
VVKPASAQENKDRLLEFCLEIGSSFPLNKNGESPENILSYEEDGIGGDFRLIIPLSTRWLLSLRAGGMGYTVNDGFNDILFDSLRDDYYISSSPFLSTFHTRVNAAIGYRVPLGRTNLVPEISIGINSVEFDSESSNTTIKRKGSNEQYRFSLNGMDHLYTDLGFSTGARFSYPLLKNGGLNFTVTPQFFFTRERLNVISQFEGLAGEIRTYPQHFSRNFAAFSIYVGIAFSPAGCCWSIPVPSSANER